jgi:flagellar basal-body rod protein FlgF
VNIGIYQNAASLSALEKWEAAVSQNISAAQIPGFRKKLVEFSAINTGQYGIAKGTNGSDSNTVEALFPTATNQISYAKGVANPTGADLDIALQTDGFFSVQRSDGTTAYTRNGQFKLDSTRTIVNSNGDKLLSDTGSPITLSEIGGAVTISSTGNIVQRDIPLGKIGVRTFTNTSDLVPISGGLFVPTNGAQAQPATNPGILQGYLEGSNVSAMNEMVDLVSITRFYEANQKVITSADQQMQRTLDALG